MEVYMDVDVDVAGQVDDGCLHAYRHPHALDTLPVHDENGDLFASDQTLATSVDDASTSRNADSTSPLGN